MQPQIVAATLLPCLAKPLKQGIRKKNYPSGGHVLKKSKILSSHVVVPNVNCMCRALVSISKGKTNCQLFVSQNTLSTC